MGDSIPFRQTRHTMDYLLVIVVGISGLVAGWLNCFDSVKKSPTPVGWFLIVLIITATSLSILNIDSTKNEKKISTDSIKLSDERLKKTEQQLALIESNLIETKTLNNQLLEKQKQLLEEQKKLLKQISVLENEQKKYLSSNDKTVKPNQTIKNLAASKTSVKNESKTSSKPNKNALNINHATKSFAEFKTVIEREFQRVWSATNIIRFNKAPLDNLLDEVEASLDVGYWGIRQCNRVSSEIYKLFSFINTNPRFTGGESEIVPLKDYEKNTYHMAHYRKARTTADDCISKIGETIDLKKEN